MTGWHVIEFATLVAAACAAAYLLGLAIYLVVVAVEAAVFVATLPRRRPGVDKKESPE